MTIITFHLTEKENLPNNYSIKQGETLDWLHFYYSDDVSTWIPKGQIRKDYLYKQGELLTEFNFETLVYGEFTLNNITNYRTKITPYLTDEQTSLLPIPNKRKGQTIIGDNVWVYSIELESPQGKVIRLVEGYVEILPEVVD